MSDFAYLNNIQKICNTKFNVLLYYDELTGEI